MSAAIVARFVPACPPRGHSGGPGSQRPALRALARPLRGGRGGYTSTGEVEVLVLRGTRTINPPQSVDNSPGRTGARAMLEQWS